jgi:hypothetical protein
MIFTVKCWLLFTYNEKFIQYYYITLLQPLRLPTARMFGAISFPSLPISLYSSPPTLVFLSLCNALGRFCVRSINFGCDLFSNPVLHSCTLPDLRLHLDVILLSTRYGGWLFMILASHRSKWSGYISQPVCNGHPICLVVVFMDALSLTWRGSSISLSFIFVQGFGMHVLIWTPCSDSG